MSILMREIHRKKLLQTCLPSFRRTKLATVVLLFGTTQMSAWATDMFNPNALEIDNPSKTPVDLSLFSSAGGQAPGEYRVDIYINGDKQDTRTINFVSGTDGQLNPQLTPAMLTQFGVKLNSVPSLMAMSKDAVITDLTKYIPQSTTRFDFSHQKLAITVPQDNMTVLAQGAVDPKLWDDGVSALLVNYNFTGSNTWQDNSDGHNDSYFLNLRSGINLGGWRLRNYSTWNYSKSRSGNGGIDKSGNPIGHDNDASSRWDSINTYVQHDIDDIKGQFTAGDSFTPSEVFDSVQFRGAQVASDDNMLPDSLRGFAPTVRGIANSNAKVTIRQNGSVIYQAYVPPGAFTITDLYPTSSSGGLQVTITEADGSERVFMQPFSNVPVMQREGRLKYAFTVGKYRAPNDYGKEPLLGQATLLYGLPHDMTVYGGFQTADNYNALALGLGVGLGEIGSISLDATQSYATLSAGTRDESRAGQSYRFQYSKNITATDSTITLAGYRYSSKGFYTFNEAMNYRYYDEDDYFNFRNNKRNRIQLDLTQNLMGGKWGALSFSGYQQDYWNREGHESSASLGYSNSLNGINWTVLYTYTDSANSRTANNQQLALSVSVPLSKWLPNSYINNSITNDLHGKTYNQVGLSGTALADNNLSYSVAQGYGNRDRGYSGQINADYRSTYGQVNAGYNYAENSRQINYGLQGSIIAHPHGITLGQPMAGDVAAVALVRAPGADGVKIENGTGVYTDWRGYTIVPYLSPYKRSRVALDPGTLSDDVDLQENVKTVVPTSGAVVLADFKTNVGARVLMTLQQAGGQAVPFGATVSVNGDDSNTGIVGEEGQVYLSGVPESGSLVVKWGNGDSQQCHANFTLPSVNYKGKATGMLRTMVNCG